MTKPALVKDGILTIVVVVVFCCLFMLTYAFGDTPSDSPAVVSAPVQTKALQASVPSSVKTIQPPQNSIAAEATATLTVEELEVKVDSSSSNTEENKEKQNTAAVEKPVPNEPIKIITPVSPLSSAADRSQYTQELRRHIIEATNVFRKKHKMPALAYENTLQQNAQAYSKTMLAGDFLSHTDTKGCDMSCRVKKDGYKASAWGENLAVLKFGSMPETEEVASFFMRGWEKSSGHRENLLSPLFTHQGIGIAVDDDAIYVTVQFADPL